MLRGLMIRVETMLGMSGLPSALNVIGAEITLPAAAKMGAA
jgi:hypothetical protein